MIRWISSEISVANPLFSSRFEIICRLLFSFRLLPIVVAPVPLWRTWPFPLLTELCLLVPIIIFFFTTYCSILRSFPAPFCSVITSVCSPNNLRFVFNASSVYVDLTNTITRSASSLYSPDKQARTDEKCCSVPSSSSTVIPFLLIASTCGW